MKKNQFIILFIGIIAGLFFSLGLCMCLLPEWNLFIPGIILAAIGLVSLLALWATIFINSSKERAPINWKLVGKIVYGIISCLVLGTGMAMIMVWNLVILGIAVGVVGIVMLLFLIPMCVGLKQ